jgi:hypothetical protein
MNHFMILFYNFISLNRKIKQKIGARPISVIYSLLLKIIFRLLGDTVVYHLKYIETQLCPADEFTKIIKEIL